MRVAAILLAIGSALPAADPAAWLPADAAVTARVPDLARSAERWSTTPYPGLLATAWGQVMVNEFSGRIERQAPGLLAAAASLRAIAAGVNGSEPMQPQFTVAAAGDEALIRQPLTLLPATADGAIAVPTGRLSLTDGVLAWTSIDGDGPVVPGQAAPPALGDPDADLEVHLDLRRWLTLMTPPGTAPPVLPAAQPTDVTVDVKLDPIGIREVIRTPGNPAMRAAASRVKRWADPVELRRAPATALWAVTWTSDAELTSALMSSPELKPDADALDKIESVFAGAGLPGYMETLQALDGPSVVWMAEGVPFPTLTAALSIKEPVAKRWIEAVATRFNLAATPDGGRGGYIGLLPLAIGWSAEGATGGRLILTTDVQGLAAWKNRIPGFDSHAAVRSALAEAPPRAVMLGAGRGGASWAAIAQLAVPLFMGMGAPQAASLPQDLRKAGGYGYLTLALGEDGGSEVKAGGLFGGPMTTMMALGITVPTTMYMQREMRRARRHAVDAPAPEAEPQPQPEPPAAPMF
jgi:hypothetical protein